MPRVDSADGGILLLVTKKIETTDEPIVRRACGGVQPEETHGVEQILLQPSQGNVNMEHRCGWMDVFFTTHCQVLLSMLADAASYQVCGVVHAMHAGRHKDEVQTRSRPREGEKGQVPYLRNHGSPCACERPTWP